MLNICFMMFYVSTGSIRCFLLPWVSEVHLGSPIYSTKAWRFLLRVQSILICSLMGICLRDAWLVLCWAAGYPGERLHIHSDCPLPTVSWLSTLRKRTYRYRYTIYSRCFNDMVWGSKILLWSCRKAIPLDLYIASLVAVEKLSQTDIILRANCYLVRTPQQGITSVPTQYRL